MRGPGGTAMDRKWMKSCSGPVTPEWVRSCGTSLRSRARAGMRSSAVRARGHDVHPRDGHTRYLRGAR